jgi:hypothetical protein
MMDWRQVWNKDLVTHRQRKRISKDLETQTQAALVTCSNEENKLCQMMTKKNKQIVM